MDTFLVESLILSPSQALHQEADVRFGNPGSRHVHDATVWLILQLERRLWRADGTTAVTMFKKCCLLPQYWLIPASPPTDDGDVASKASVGVAETLAAPQAPDSEPVQAGGAELWGLAASGGWRRLCGWGNRRGGPGLAGAECSWETNRLSF